MSEINKQFPQDTGCGLPGTSSIIIEFPMAVLRHGRQKHKGSYVSLDVGNASKSKRNKMAFYYNLGSTMRNILQKIVA